MKKSFLDIVEEALVNVDEVDCIQLKHAKDNGEDFILIDSREREEWDASRIPNSVHISKGLIEKMVEANIPDRDTKLIIYCQSGFRSVLACESIKRMGYNQVSSLKGGISEWQSSGFPIED